MRSDRAKNSHRKAFLSAIVSMAVIGLSCVLGQNRAFGQDTEEKAEIKGLGQCGLVTRYASSQINDTCLTEANNVYLDEDAGISRRGGFAKYNAAALPDEKSVRGVWPFRATDGTDYIVALSSMSMFQSNGQGTFSAIPGLSSLSATQDMDCSQCLGKLWCVNGSDTMFSWDGTSTAPVSGAPTCSAIDCFRNRVVLANCSGTLSQLRLSGELDGTDYTIPATAVSTSPATLSIGGANDGNKLVGIMGVYQDVLVMGKFDSTYGLYGFDRRDFTVRELSREIGIVDNRSAREKQGSLYWLSKRGVEKMTGPSITRISDPVRDLFDTIIVAGGNSRSITDTSQVDFQQGNLTFSGAGAPMSATISPGNVVPSTFSVLENAEFATYVNIASGTYGISLSTIFHNSGFEAGTIENWQITGVGVYPSRDQWQIDSTSKCSGGTFNPESEINGKRYSLAGCSCGDPGAAFPALGNARFQVDVLKASDSSVLNSKIYYHNYLPSSSCQLDSFDVSTYDFPIKIRAMSNLDSPSPTYATSVAFSSNVPNGTIYFGGAFDGPSECHSLTCGSSLVRMFFDMYDPYYLSTGSFVSTIIDTKFSTPTFGHFNASISSFPEGGIAFKIQASSANDGGGFEPLLDQIVGNKIVSQNKRYLRYAADFNTTSSTKTPVAKNISLVSATTGYFVSRCLPVGNAITQWGLMQCNQEENDGSLSLEVSTGSTCDEVGRTTATWNTQTNNSVISVSTSAYLGYRRLFTIDSATQTPTHKDCTVNWNEGTSRPSVSAEVYRERYYLAYTSGTSGTVVNDHIAVLDSRDQWTIHDAPNCSALGMYNRGLYCGDSGDSGRVYKMDVGHDDDGAAFTSSIKTKDYDLGNPFQQKILKRMYFDLAGLPNIDYSISLTPSYTLDASTDTFSMPSINLNEDYSRFIPAKVPAPLEYNTTGRWFSFGLSHSGTEGPWKLYGLRFVFNRLPED